MSNVTHDLETWGWSSRRLEGADSELLLLKKQAQEKQLRRAAIGTSKLHQSTIRGDQIAWLEDSQSEFLDQLIANLMKELSEYFRCHLERFEGHFSYYAPGTRYQAHYDQSSAPGSETTDRVFSFILYLNDGWQKFDGGELRLLLDKNSIDIEPRLGNFVIFRSDTILHEVLETRAGRWAVSGWFRRK